MPEAPVSFRFPPPGGSTRRMNPFIIIFFLLLALPSFAAELEVCFTPGEDCAGKIASEINAAREKILVQAYSEREQRWSMEDKDAEGIVNVLLNTVAGKKVTPWQLQRDKEKEPFWYQKIVKQLDTRYSPSDEEILSVVNYLKKRRRRVGEANIEKLLGVRIRSGIGTESIR